MTDDVLADTSGCLEHFVICHHSSFTFQSIFKNFSYAAVH